MRMSRFFQGSLMVGMGMLTWVAFTNTASAQQDIVCVQGNQAPEVNGVDGGVWQGVQAYTIRDNARGETIYLKSMCVADKVSTSKIRVFTICRAV